MCERFIKFIPSEKANFLQEHYPNAFLLLALIARHARRKSGNPDGLLIGDAILGDPEKAGLTRQEHRTAIEKLVEFGYIEIVYNGKKFLKREKSTIKITIKSMLVNLKDSSIWDINPEISNQQINQRATNEQPTSNHKQERTRKKEEEQQPQTPSSDSVSVVVFPCLSKISDSSVTEKHKIEITRQNLHQEQVVINAVEAVLEKNFTPRETMLKALRGAIKQKWEPARDDSEKNKALAKLIEGEHGKYKFEALSNELEIVKGVTGLCSCILYTMPYEKFCQEIEKQGRINLNEILGGLNETHRTA